MNATRWKNQCKNTPTQSLIFGSTMQQKVSVWLPILPMLSMQLCTVHPGPFLFHLFSWQALTFEVGELCMLHKFFWKSFSKSMLAEEENKLSGNGWSTRLGYTYPRSKALQKWPGNETGVHLTCTWGQYKWVQGIIGVSVGVPRKPYP